MNQFINKNTIKSTYKFNVAKINTFDIFICLRPTITHIHANEDLQKNHVDFSK